MLVPYVYKERSTDNVFTMRVRGTDTIIRIPLRVNRDLDRHAGVTWDAAFVLAEWCNEQECQWSQVGPCIDLSGGTGVLAAALSALGAQQVFASEHPDAVEQLRCNLEGTPVEVIALSWGQVLPAVYSWVFVADCVFGEYDLRALAVTLLDAIARGMRVCCAYKRREIAKEEALFWRKFPSRIRLTTPTAYSITQIELYELK